MSKPASESWFRTLWKRIEWSPWTLMIIFFVLHTALGLGSSRSLMAGTGMGLFGGAYAILWKWACRHVRTERLLRLINATCQVILYCVNIEAARFTFHRSNALEALIGFAVVAGIMGPARYFQDIPYPPEIRERPVAQARCGSDEQ